MGDIYGRCEGHFYCRLSGKSENDYRAEAAIDLAIIQADILNEMEEEKDPNRGCVRHVC